MERTGIARGRMTRPVALFPLLLAPLLAAGPARAEDPDQAMFKVQLVMLKAGPGREQPAGKDPRQEQHQKLLETLLRERRALAAGPIENGGDLRGLVVLDVESQTEAEKLLAGDPWLASGHLVAEYRTWFVAKKLFKPPAGAFLDVESCTFALLVRPADAPQLPDEERVKIQAGHMANIGAMADAGELLIAGPFVEDTPLRGVFVFRGTDRAKIDGLTAKDPAVQRGRLKVVPYTWWLSKGVLPKG